MKRLIFPYSVLVLLFPLIGSAQTTGILKGKVIDKATKEPLPSVNVVVKGTYYGASTDFDGNYTIQRINPGVYVVEVKLLGYKVVQFPAVKIVEGKTTELNVQLEETALSLGQEIEVVGEKPMFDIEETSSKRTIGTEELEAAAVKNVQEVVALQVGVVQSDDQIHIRGGRSYETAYIVDGISVQDPLSGTGFGLQLPPGAIQEAEVITGGYNAEYGQATSGVISLTTKEGSDSFNGTLGHKRDHFWLNTNSRTNFNTDIYDFMFSGPEILTRYILPKLGLEIPGKISFFINGNVNLTDGYTRWVERINADGIPDGWILKAPRGLKSAIIKQSWLAPRRSNNWSLFGKVTWKITPTIKVSYAGTYAIIVNQNTQSIRTTLEYQEPQPGYQYLYQQIPDSANTFAQINMQQAVSLTHTISPKTFYEVRFSRFIAHLRADANGRGWEYYQEPKDVVTHPIVYRQIGVDSILVIPGDGFYDMGSPSMWRDQYVDEYTVKFDLTSNITEKNKFKTGFECRFQYLQMVDIYKPWVRPLGYDNDIYSVHPAIGAVYVQNSLTHSGMILNIGLRFDYWIPGKYVDDAMRNEQESLVSPVIRREYFKSTYSIFGVRWKGRLSPRLAIAHPVSDNQTLFFSYGHFSKFPRPQYVYTKLLRSSARSTSQTIGNPNLNPETTVAYELGLRNQITENDVLNITAYYKDIFDYVTTRTVQLPVTGYSTGTYTTYINQDYTRSRGFEIEYKKRIGSWFRGSLSLAYSITTGKSSSAEEAKYNILNNLEENVKEKYTSWDRPFQGSLNLNFRVQKGQPLFGFGGGVLDDYNVFIRMFYQSGKRYTPQILIGHDPSNGRPVYSDDYSNPYGKVGKDVMTVNVNFEKYFTVGPTKLTVSLEITNLFNRDNAQILNPVTGDAYKPKNPNGSWTAVPYSWNDPGYPDTQAPISPYPYNPARFMEPRHITLGVAVSF
ncbi:MAG: TonB-dependent receptor [Bacteroidetes bacterium]|nr:TonB-dependent receptor [Bacteroidota bacterium]